MKTKNLFIIFSLFLLITLACGAAVFLTQEKNEIKFDKQLAEVKKQAKPAKTAPTSPGKNKIPPTPFVKGGKNVVAPAEEKINAVMIVNGVKYQAAVKPDSSVYDLMNELKIKNKISFFGKNYSELGFFVEKINGVKNDPAGKNWIYYVNGQPAQIGVSNYLIKTNDIIEWKYEKKNF